MTFFENFENCFRKTKTWIFNIDVKKHEYGNKLCMSSFFLFLLRCIFKRLFVFTLSKVLCSIVKVFKNLFDLFSFAFLQVIRTDENDYLMIIVLLLPIVFEEENVTVFSEGR